MNTLHINNLLKKYGSHTVLEQDEWEVLHGTYWVKGGNGAGKTTLFKVIAGQIPYIGQIRLNAIAMRTEPVQYRSMVSYAPAEPQYPSFITGNELLDYYTHIRQTNRSVINPLVEAFHMSGFMANKIETYSSGMLKKLSLLCAFAGNNQLYLLDEPFITIDAAASDTLYAYISTLQKEGRIILISSHQDIDCTKVNLSGAFSIEDKRIRPC